MKRARAVLSAVVIIVTFVALAPSVFATTADMYFSYDRNGQTLVTNIQEGDKVWICVYDPDENIDADQRDKIFTGITVVDPNTNARLSWNNTGDTHGNYLEETAANSGLFVSKLGFMIGRRADVTSGDWTHNPGALSNGADLYITGDYTQLGVTGG